MNVVVAWAFTLVVCSWCIGLNEGRRVCVPEKIYVEPCQVCKCSKDGFNMYCQKKDCEQDEYQSLNPDDYFDVDSFLPKERIPYLDDEIEVDKEEEFENDSNDISDEKFGGDFRFEKDFQDIELNDDVEDIGQLPPNYRFRREILI
ncbi:PREDICTED: uncharacterized protein LOC108561514 [Nicrophorus vespilloides]|uniref:Uncharacterized protein LOC108561514 n=1 Tax=Nicrophorus vespilloides TaxID=110193 RepID=A0ABM1MK76_NICVS|nr:PREDICTED: uncharacterized protein LOC108561514 [Nicrophorus vespilloides]